MKRYGKESFKDVLYTNFEKQATVIHLALNYETIKDLSIKKIIWIFIENERNRNRFRNKRFINNIRRKEVWKPKDNKKHEKKLARKQRQLSHKKRLSA